SLELVRECGASGKPFGGPFRPWPVIKAFSRRANHQFTLVVLTSKVRKCKILKLCYFQLQGFYENLTVEFCVAGAHRS
ncbi:MAG: hypothetical protein LRY71_08350, partial [Bacillaceae bacterium]|nr:hypothetical protein [Bacillaceae bacterium]